MPSSTSKQLISLTHFPDGTRPQRVLIDPTKIVAVLAFGTGREAGVDIYLEGMNDPIEVGIWDTHLHFVLEEVAGFTIPIFDRREVTADLNVYLKDRFDIDPPKPKKSRSRQRANRAKTRTAQRRERTAGSDHGRGRPCSSCEDEFDPEALTKVRDADGDYLYLCEECEADMFDEPEVDQIDPDDPDAMAKVAADVEDDYEDDDWDDDED